MDPLSSLKLMGAPDMTSMLSGPLQDLKSAQTIPLPDMATMTPGTSMTPASPATPGAETQAIGGAQPSYSFSNLLGNFVNEVSEKQAAAGAAVTGLLSGKNVPLHQAVISMEEASVSFQLMVEVRNKLLDSYQELMRMQV